MENKHQRQQALQREIIKKINGEPLMEIITDEDLKLMDEINNNIQTKTTWTENKRWTAAVIGLLCVIGFMSVLVIYNLFWYVIVSVLCVWLLGVMLVASKDIVDDLIDEW
jgi:ABC-type siderophore export system fused ATPase/permease subunit